MIRDKNNFDHTLLLQNRSLLLFLFYSLLFLSFPLVFNRFNLFVLALLLLIIIKFILPGHGNAREIKIFQYILIIYGFWIIIASAIHYVALRSLDPFTYITINTQNALWGLWTLKDTAIIYLMFPLLFLTALHLFMANHEKEKMLFILPVLIIPSLVLALYQGMVDIAFLNHPYFIDLHRVSGLDTDANGFGISLVLLFALCVMAILVSRYRWKKLFFILLAVILLWCMLLSGSLTGLAGVIIFAAVLPWVLAWASNTELKKRHFIMLLGPVIIVMMIVILPAGKKISPFPVVTERLSDAYVDFHKGGIEKIAKKSSRSKLGLQAYRLTKLSPLSGWAPGGYYRNARNMWYRSRSTYYIPPDNANNHYLQMSSELGLAGLSFNILLHLFPLWMVFCIQKKIQDRDERLLIGIAALTVVIILFLFITGPHTMAMSVLWILVVLLAVLFVTALKYGYTIRPFTIRFLFGSIALLSVLFFYGTYENAFGQNGYILRQQADWWPYQYMKNCYPEERIQEGKLRWCRKDAVLQIPLFKTMAERITLKICAYHPEIGSNPVIVKYGGKQGAVNEIVLKDQSWQTIDIPLSKDNIFVFNNPYGDIINYFILSLDVSRTWVPQKWGVSDDTRELGVAALIPDYRLSW